MNILYLGYWSIEEGITKSTIFEHLKVLSAFDAIEKIFFCSIERSEFEKKNKLEIPKCIHIPLYSSSYSLKFVNKLYDYTYLPEKIKKIIKHYAIDFCIAAGTQAGTIALKASFRTKAKVIISFFDPHAAYMKALGVWKTIDPRYLYLQHWENKLKKHAFALFPVSKGYYNTLLGEGVDRNRLQLVSCTVDIEKFKPIPNIRLKVRNKLGFKSNDLIAIYVGKFGGIYFDEMAFIWFNKLKDKFTKLKLIILTETNKNAVEKKLKNCGYNKSDLFIDSVPHSKVAGFLNAADFALSLITPTKMTYACSPIKNAEYWAMGLPVIIPENIGDDSQLLKQSKLGIVVKNIDNLELYFEQLQIVLSKNHENAIRELSKKYRSSHLIQKAYQKFLFNNS